MTEQQNTLLERILQKALPPDANKSFWRHRLEPLVKVLPLAPAEEWDIQPQKAGMTNHSYLLRSARDCFVLRIPGEGTDQLINRPQEAAVYHSIRDLGLCDDILFIDPDTGCKLSRFLPQARVADPNSVEDVKACMKRLRAFHEQDLRVAHSFNIFDRTEYYEHLWAGTPSIYPDYARVKEEVFALKEYIDAQPKAYTLTHIDAVPDNFLFCGDGSLRLIDWEYAGMQDPHVDLAMFCIYALYDRPAIDRLIAAYFPEGCEPAVKAKIYCYIAACGLLWSNWCEYKRQLGVEFGEYALKQYHYARDFCRLAREVMPHA